MIVVVSFVKVWNNYLFFSLACGRLWIGVAYNNNRSILVIESHFFTLQFIGETPSKKRRLSSDASESSDTKGKENAPESSKIDSENENQSTSKQTEEKMDCVSSSSENKPKAKSESKPDPKKVERSRSSSGPDIKESLGSPRPVTRQESPEPGTSQAEDQKRRTSQDESWSSSQKQSSSEDDAPPRPPRPRERPLWVDIVAKHIESLFSLLSKSASDS